MTFVFMWFLLLIGWMRNFILSKLVFLAVLFSSFLLNSQSVYAQDTSCGIIWYPQVQISDSSVNGHSTEIAISTDSIIHITYEGGGKRLAYARSTDGGNSFEPVREMLPDTSIQYLHAVWSKVVASNSNVYLFFVTSSILGSESLIHMLKSTNDGTTFGLVQDIGTDETGIIDWATISGDTIAMIYPAPPDLERAIVRTTNGGLTWSRSPEDFEYHIRIAISPEYMYGVHQVNINGADEIVFRRSTNLGTSWESEEIISESDQWYSDIPTIAAGQSDCGTELQVAWRDTKYGWFGGTGASIISRAALNDRWFPERVLTDVPNGFRSNAVTDGRRRAMAWTAEVAPEDTFHTMVAAAGQSFQGYCPSADLTPNTYRIVWPDVVLSSHAIHLAWSEYVQDEAGENFRIFYRKGEFIPSDAEVSLSTGLLELDTTDVLSTSVDSMTITNTGSSPLTIGSVVSDQEMFSVFPESFTMSPGSSATFYISFTPSDTGNQTGKVHFYHNGDSSPDCFTVTGRGIYSQKAITYEAGTWNLVSHPYRNGPKTTLPSLFSYGGSYRSEDSLVSGKGYWAKPSDSMVSYQGFPVLTDSTSITKGWNLIGSLTEPVLISSIQSLPPGMITSQFFGYENSGYTIADTIHPGRAYWVKVSDAGTLILASGSEAPLPSQAKHIRIIANSEELPPVAPGTSLDEVTDETTDEERSTVPLDYALYQNFPNPFNPETEIKFTVKETGLTTLRVYDVLGKEVSTLVNEIKTPGEYRVHWKAEGLPGGVYFYELQSGFYRSLGKAILIK